ncbi:hypothetical protein Tco_0530197 [Tanacetum coccineum]
MLKSVNIKVGEFIEFCTVSGSFHVNVVALALSLPSQSRSDIGCAGPESTKPVMMVSCMRCEDVGGRVSGGCDVSDGGNGDSGVVVSGMNGEGSDGGESE